MLGVEEASGAGWASLPRGRWDGWPWWKAGTPAPPCTRFTPRCAYMKCRHLPGEFRQSPPQLPAVISPRGRGGTVCGFCIGAGAV